MEELQQLNEAQREAVMATEGHVRVIAGAGSGKTRALSHRFAFLVNEIGILPGNILCVTFTNKSATEMRRRIHALTGDDDTGYVCTFHSFCVSVLQEDSHAVQYPKSFLVLDNSDIDSMLKIIYEERGLTLRDMTFSAARDMIEMQKCIRKPEYYLDMISFSLEDLQKKYRNAVETEEIIFYGYLYQEKKCFGLDYNDLIKFSLYIFEQNPEIRRKWQQRLEYIMIDEFQDIDDLQIQLMEVLAGYHRNLFVVGDPDQTIYTWRGANVKYLTQFDSVYPDTKTIFMMDNYRSTPQILAACNSLIEKNESRIRKDLRPVLPAGPLPVCHMADSAEKEAEWIAEQIKNRAEEGRPWRDMAVLCRAHYLTRPLEERFIRENIPYVITSGTPFFGRMEIKDALSYLRMIAFKDDLSFLRIANVPKRNLGQRRMQALAEKAEQEGCTLYEALKRLLEEELFRSTRAAAFVKLVEKFAASYEGRPISEVLSELLDESGYEAMLRTEGSQDRLDNLAELKQSVYEYETTCGEEASLPDYLRHIALFTNQDADSRQDAVKIMTVHTAKGLEFPVVFVCGLNEGIFPSKKTASRAAMEEERRLAFVAFTRAEQELLLSCAGGRTFDGAPRVPSRFLLDIDQGLLAFTEEPDPKAMEEARRAAAAGDRRLKLLEETVLLAEGTRIRHAVFGEGVIQETDLEKNAYRILFDGMDTPRSISFRVRLETAEEKGISPGSAG